MAETLKHECGIAMIRLLKPLSYYRQKYGTNLYALNKLYLLMEKQHNRGQEGAGLACVKLTARPGEEYIFRERAMGTNAIQEIFAHVHAQMASGKEEISTESPFVGELYMGHLRYSTTGRSGISYVHPFLRRNNWKSRNLTLCGNFNLTNVDELFDTIVADGQHPRIYSDTFIMLEQVGHELDQENQRLYDRYKQEGFRGRELTAKIEDNIDIPRVLRRASGIWDGGYVICGMTGSGDAFAFRDPRGIRPAFYYTDDEVVVVASERPVIQTVMNVSQVGQGVGRDYSGTPQLQCLFIRAHLFFERQRCRHLSGAQVARPAPLSSGVGEDRLRLAAYRLLLYPQHGRGGFLRIVGGDGPVPRYGKERKIVVL